MSGRQIHVRRADNFRRGRITREFYNKIRRVLLSCASAIKTGCQAGTRFLWEMEKLLFFTTSLGADGISLSHDMMRYVKKNITSTTK